MGLGLWIKPEDNRPKVGWIGPKEARKIIGQNGLICIGHNPKGLGSIDADQPIDPDNFFFQFVKA